MLTRLTTGLTKKGWRRVVEEMGLPLTTECASKTLDATSLAGNGRFMLPIYTSTMFLSALLLFSIQPMFAKMVLPTLGGAPSVWAVALLFFQGALLVGYAYAHLLTSRLTLARAGAIHLAFSAVTLLSLPIGLATGWSEPPPGDPYLWQLGLFTVSIGLPFVAVSANAPLLQAWFGRSHHAGARNPYFLYAASNLGSLVALLGYPFVLEPAFGLKALASLWAWAFVLLIGALALCFSFALRSTWKGLSATASQSANGDVDASPGPRDRAQWVLLALVPSGLLTAFTTHIATDVASAPLIWVIPLALYLATFVIVFRERSLISPGLLLTLHVIAVPLALLQLAQTENDTWLYSAGFGVAAFVTATLVAHRTLYEARPAPRYLTEFYMWMSLGGVLGGLFSALIAPRLFSEVLEYPLLLALTFACRPGALRGLFSSWWSAAAFAAMLFVGIFVIFGVPWLAATWALDFGVWGSTAAVAALFTLAAIGLWRRPDLQLAAAGLLFLTVALLPSLVHRGDAERSYFGVYRILRSSTGAYNILHHGTTLHGAQRVRDETGRPVLDTTPITYYHPHSPMGTMVRVMGMFATAQREEPRFGVVGLGTGSLACHSASGETWRFFEIDPAVVAIAKSQDFTFLTTCQPKADVVLGDARLTLAKEADGSYNLLTVDAFSSDAVPVHLLTAEAIRLYASKIKPNGAVVLHISNRYLDLEGVLATTIPNAGGYYGLAVGDDANDGYDRMGSTIVVVTKSKDLRDYLKGLPGARDLPAEGLRVWTDDFSDILGPFLSQYRKSHN